MRKLERKYLDFFVTHTANMSIEDAQEYLELLRNNPPEYLPQQDIDNRVEKLSGYINKYRYSYRLAEKRAQKDRKLAETYRKLTGKWLEAGATYEEPDRYDTITAWYFRGEPFFRWKTRDVFENVVADAEAADERFEAIRRGER